MTIVNKQRTKRKKRAPQNHAGLMENPSQGPTPTGYFRWKGILDRVLASLLLLPGLPLIAVLIVCVRMTSSGPGVYRQQRVGRDGKTFTMYKLRSMTCDAESRTGPVWTQHNDPRVTPLGRLLRNLHLDELPQLLNVLKGEMSLIGPRPERPEFVEVLAEQIPGYRDRLLVLPGITGLAQINLPPDTDLESVRRKQVLDLEYIETASLFLDARMFVVTLFRLFALPSLWATKTMGLHRTVTIAPTDATAPTKLSPVQLADQSSS